MTESTGHFEDRPDTFGPYRVATDLDAHSFGSVLSGRDRTSHSRVVIYTFERLPEVWRGSQGQPALLASFDRLCAAGIDHPNIASPLGCGEEKGIPYIAYAQVPGTPMDGVRRDGAGPMAKVLERVTQIAAAIDAAAAAGIHHGDLRPSDILFDVDATRVSRVGLAQALLAVGIPVDTIVSYSSPQRVAGAQPTASDDVYSLAAIALELVIGGSADSSGEARQASRTERGRASRPAPHETRLFTRLRGIDAGLLRASFAAALSDTSEERPATAAEFVATFRKAFVARDESAEPVPPPAALVRHIVADVPDDVLPLPARTETDERHDELPLHDVDRGRAVQAAGYAPAVRWTTEEPSEEPPRRGLLIALVVGVVGLVATFVVGFALGQRSEGTEPESAGVGQETVIDEPQPGPTLAPARVTTGDSAPGARLAASSSQAELGRILVRSTPEGADVQIDGEARGVTPLVVRDVTLGDHTVEVSYPGLPPQLERVTLSADRPAQSIELMLTSVSIATRPAAYSSGFGALHVDSRPSRAQVFLDNTFVGATPLLVPNVSAGAHRVEIRLPEYRNWSTSVHIEPNTPFRVAASLER